MKSVAPISVSTTDTDNGNLNDDTICESSIIDDLSSTVDNPSILSLPIAILESPSPVLNEPNVSNIRPTQTAPMDISVVTTPNGIVIPPTKVLMIGLSYNRSIVKQMKDKQLPSMAKCTDDKGKPLESSVMRDTWRCYKVEECFHNTILHTCNILQDGMRNMDSSTNLNCSCSSNIFLRNVLEMGI